MQLGVPGRKGLVPKPEEKPRKQSCHQELNITRRPPVTDPRDDQGPFMLPNTAVGAFLLRWIRVEDRFVRIGCCKWSSRNAPRVCCRQRL